MHGLCAAGQPNIDFAFAHTLLISAAPLCDNANIVINSAEYNGCHSADKEPRRDHVFRRQAKITALLMLAEGTKCFHKQATAFVFPLWRRRVGWGGGEGCARFHVFVTQTEHDRMASVGSGDWVKFGSFRAAMLNETLPCSLSSAQIEL